jgi:hypothetical protein
MGDRPASLDALTAPQRSRKPGTVRLGADEEEQITSYVTRAIRATIAGPSTMAAMLERAARVSRDSEGKRHKREPLWERDEQGRIIGQRQYTWAHVHERRSSEPSYEPTHVDLLSHATTGRRLRAVGRLSHLAFATLSAFYGDAGKHWAGRRQGQLWCLAPLTATGQAMLSELRARGRGEGRDQAATLADEDEAEQLHSIESRRATLRKIRDEAAALLSAACELWRGTDGLEGEDEG